MIERYSVWARYVCALLLAVSPSALAAKPLTLVEDGRALATIVIADDALPLPADWRLDWTTRDAAAFLQDYIRRVSGATLPIVRESDATEAATSPIILVGDTQRGRTLGLSPDDLPSEGYRIKSFDGGVAIVGDIHQGIDRGTLLGIYHFLEDVAGVRWYFPGDIGTIIPKRDTLTAASLDITHRPHFELRIGGVGYWPTEIARQWHPALRFGAREGGLVANHTHEGWNDRFADSHPEYFGLRPDGTRAITTDRAVTGQSRAYLCYSEPAVLEQHLADVDAYFERGDTTGWQLGVQPRGNIIPFGPNDVRQVCACERCSQLVDRGRGRYGFSSDLIFDFVVRFAQRLKERHPDAILSVLAYDHYQLPPTKIDRLPDNVMVTLCLLPTLTQAPHPEIREHIWQITEKWSSLVNHDRQRLIIWDYFVYPNNWFIAPTEIPHMLQRYTKMLEDRALGMFNNGFNPRTKPGPRLHLSFRNVWMMHQLLWNPDLDLEQARYDWCHDLFGPAGDVMDRFYKLLERRWEETPWTRKPVAATVKHRRVYGEVYTPQVVAELKQLLAEAAALCEPGSDERRRLDWFVDEAFNPFFAMADAHHHALKNPARQVVARVAAPPIIDAVLDESMWRSASAMTLVDKRNAMPAEQASHVYAAWDDEHLYIAARLDLASEPASDVQPQQSGADNDQLDRDDLFIVNLAAANPNQGYVELALNPRGAWSTSLDLFRRRGLLSSSRLRAWGEGRAPRAAAAVHDGVWTVEAAIPWSAIPDLDGMPERLSAQFSRWPAGRYYFDSWSPTLEPWGFALNRFGTLTLSANPPVIYAHQVAQLTQMLHDADVSPVDGEIHVKMDRPFFIVGQRDLEGPQGLEVRSILRFDLAGLPRNPAQIDRAILNIHVTNAIRTIGQEQGGQPREGMPPLVNPQQPFDPVIVDHIVTADAKSITAADYDIQALQANVGTLIEGPIQTRHTYTLDVTDQVRRDIDAGRTATTLRLRHVDGYTVRDGHSHYLILRDSSPKHPHDQWPQLTVQTTGTR